MFHSNVYKTSLIAIKWQVYRHLFNYGQITLIYQWRKFNFKQHNFFQKSPAQRDVNDPCIAWEIDSIWYGYPLSKGLFIWEKLSRLSRETVPTRSRHNANFHQQKISVHMSWEFPRLTEVSPITNRDLG